MTTTNEQSSRELLPCPFCGHVGPSFAEGSTFRWLAYSCNGCGISNEVRVQTLGEGTKEEWLANARAEAIKEWNARSPLPPIAITAEEAGREGEAKDAAITERQISAGARELSNRQADGCNIDREDIWKTYGNEYIEDFRAAYLAAMNLPAAPAQSGGQGNG